MAIAKCPTPATAPSAAADAFIDGAPDALRAPAAAPVPRRKGGRKQSVPFEVAPDLLQAFDAEAETAGLSRSQVLAVAMAQVIDGGGDEALELARRAPLAIEAGR